MRSNPYQNYLENEILMADPLKLVVLLYRGALDAISSAREHLAAGNIRARSQAVTKAMNIIAELRKSLDFERGGEISINLERLYAYVFGLLAEGNARQIDAPFADAEKLLSTLLEGWEENARKAEADATPTTCYTQREDEPESERLVCAF